MHEPEGNDHQNNTEQDTQQAPPTIERPHPAVNNATSSDCCKQKKKNWPQYIEAVCAVLLVIITGTYTYYAAGQLHKMKRSTEAAEKAANTAASTLINSQQQSELDQRAWVGISSQNVDELSAQAFKAEIEFFNSGKTPARRVQKSISLMTRPRPLLDSPDTEGVNSLRFSGNSVLPPQGHTTITTLSDPQTMQQMTQIFNAHYAAIDAGTQILYVFGEIKYDDLSDRPHTTKYCLFAVKVRQTPVLWKLGECNGFNEMD
jgi:hypothetical protein